MDQGKERRRGKVQPQVSAIGPVTVLLLGPILLFRLLLGPTFFAVLAGLFVYDILKATLFLPFRVGRAPARFGRQELLG